MTKKTYSKTRSTTFDVNKLRQKYQKMTTKNTGSKDDRFWSLTVDKDDVGEATVRFLPGQGETQFIEKYFHYFEGAGGKLWEICPNTLGRDHECPICKENSVLYKSGEEGEKIASSRKKQKKYICNIYVVDDKGNPDNNGKVFLYEFGPDILNRIFAQLDVETSEDEDEVTLPQVIPFSVDETGADFVIQSHKEKGYRKYTKSRYKKPKPLNVDDIDVVLEQQTVLQDFFETEIASKVKSYEELEEKMEKVLKKRTVTASANDAVQQSMDEEAEKEESISETSEEFDIGEDEDFQSVIDSIVNAD